MESAAVAAGWWHWTVPVTSRLLVDVPFIGLVDWFFVGVDFLLPFALLTAGGPRRRPARFLSLLAFPIHFGAHCFVDRIGGSLPIPAFHLVHWAGLALLLVLAGRSTAVDPAFAGPADRRLGWIPIAALGTILIEVAAVDLLVARRAGLLPAVLPALAVALRATRPVWGLAAGAAGIVLGFWIPPLLLAAVPAAVAWRRSLPRDAEAGATARSLGIE